MCTWVRLRWVENWEPIYIWENDRVQPSPCTVHTWQPEDPNQWVWVYAYMCVWAHVSMSDSKNSWPEKKNVKGATTCPLLRRHCYISEMLQSWHRYGCTKMWLCLPKIMNTSVWIYELTCMRLYVCVSMYTYVSSQTNTEQENFLLPNKQIEIKHK